MDPSELKKLRNKMKKAKKKAEQEMVNQSLAMQRYFNKILGIFVWNS